MDQPINFNNFRSITGGDENLEAELFRIFVDSAAECIDGLKRALSEENNEAWRALAHALKGNSFNLGAEPLGKLCAQAQKDCCAPTADKVIILTSIQEEMERVKGALSMLPRVK